MKYLLFISLLGSNVFGFAQTSPKLYLNFTTHNEMLNENYDTDSVYFAEKVHFLEQIADTLVAKNAKWNYQTCSKFVLGVLKYQHGGSNPDNILARLSALPQVTIDPRAKQQLPFYKYNIADVVKLLDSVGVPDSRTVGGFIYYPYNSEDWTQYQQPVQGKVFQTAWQADILWGGGSMPAHTHDANNYGVWKPSGGTDSTAFFTHHPGRHLWLVGNGCAYVVDNTTDVPALFSEIKTEAMHIATGVYPADRFYCLSITFNQRDFSENLCDKLGRLTDSVNTLVKKGQVQWATIQEKLALFQQWASDTGIPHSRWACGETLVTAAPEPPAPSGNELLVLPNPASERVQIRAPDGISLTEVRIFDASGRLYWHGAPEGIPGETMPAGIYRVWARDDCGRVYRTGFVHL